MSSIKEALKDNANASEVFRALIAAEVVKSNSELIDLLFTEYESFPSSAAIAIINWNRGTNPKNARIGLDDGRLNEILNDVWPPQNR